MRWDNLLADAEDARTLPGYRDPAVIRRFDAPEALDTRFYEVHCKSAINKVPKQSRMPFRHTINPYRGCSHACTYCARPDTPVLMANGRVKPIGDLEVGDRIYGTIKQGAYRRYAVTAVQAHWRTHKAAYRVILEDGTELVTSGDHRFLSGRGWKYVTGAENGRDRRPHLTFNDELLGTGAFATQPNANEDYRRGYLCGLVRGEVSDLEALRRAREYLAGLDVPTDEFAFQAAAGNRRAVTAIRSSAKANVDRVRELVRWPWSPGADWSKGFLAGIFDAEGSCGREALRISNTDPAIVDQTVQALRRFGFEVVVEDPERANGLRVVRLRGGLREKLRFFHTVDPAITRKRDIEGLALKSDARLGVVSIEPLGEDMEMYDITTGTSDFIANGVVSHNCFARPTHKFLDFDAGRDFEREIVVKVNLPEVLRAEVARPSWTREHVALGTNTDPYQWVEGRYKLMPEIWRALLESGTPCSLLTKSPLMLRDIDLMTQLAERVGFTANVSVPTLDEKAWRATEPHTPHPRKRLEAIAELARAGIPTGVLIAPLMPGINDSPEQVERILQLATEAGAGSISGITLHLRGEVRDVFMGWLRAQRPDLVAHYERLYARGAYAPTAQRREHAELLREARARTGAPSRSDGRQYRTRGRDPAPDGEPARAPAAQGEGSPKQESLF